MTTDRRAAEADLVREHLPLTSRAVNELSRRLPAHVHRDDLLSAATCCPAATTVPTSCWSTGSGAPT